MFGSKKMLLVIGDDFYSEQMLIRNNGFSMIFTGILRVLLVKLRTSCNVTKGFVATAHYLFKSLETKFQLIESSFLDVALLLSIDFGPVRWSCCSHVHLESTKKIRSCGNQYGNHPHPGEISVFF